MARKAPTNKPAAGSAGTNAVPIVASPDLVLRTDIIPGHLAPEVRSLATSCSTLAELVERAEKVAHELEACGGRVVATNLEHADEVTRLHALAHEWMTKAEAAEKRASEVEAEVSRVQDLANGLGHKVIRTDERSDALLCVIEAVVAALRARGIVPADAPAPEPATLAALVSVLFAT